MTPATRGMTAAAAAAALLAAGAFGRAGFASADPGSGRGASPTVTPRATPAVPAAATFAYSGELTQGGWIRGTVPGGTVSLTLDGAPVEFARDGRFLVAFDRDAAPMAALEARLADSQRVTVRLTIAPRAWQIEHVSVAPRPASIPSEEFKRIRAAELARIAAARAIRSASDGWRQDFVWPARGRISGRFGSQRIYRGTPGSYHSGIDIAAAGGTPFVAPADGIVILAAAAPFTLEGRLLMIDHGAGLNSAFLHCSELLVREGQAVRRGEVVGRIGMTGRATGPHLHWSLKWRDARLDPILFTAPMDAP